MVSCSLETVEQYCGQIEAIQLKLISREPMNVCNNLDFQYTLAMELTFLLRKSFKNRKQPLGNQILTKILEIFENFIVNECNPRPNSVKNANSAKECCIYLNTLSLLKDTLKPLLSES